MPGIDCRTWVSEFQIGGVVILLLPFVPHALMFERVILGNLFAACVVVEVVGRRLRAGICSRPGVESVCLAPDAANDRRLEGPATTPQATSTSRWQGRTVLVCEVSKRLECVAVQVCHEEGARVTTNVLVWDLDLLLPVVADNRRLEVVADGLPIWVPVGFGHDSGMCLALRRFAAHRSSRHGRSGVPTSQEAQGTQEPRGSRARLVVLAIEVGGRWSLELQSFVAHLAKSKAWEQLFLLQKR